MLRRNLDRRFAETMIGLLLLIAGIAAIGGDQVVTLVLGIIGFYLLVRQFDRSQRLPWLTKESDEASMPAQPRADQVYAHALDAVRHAGLDPAETHVLPIDIGVMAFSGDQEPVIYRTRPVLDDIDYLQPFVQLRLPTRAHGRVRFEISDSDGQILFIQEEDHEFQRGRNLISPAARLPIHDAQVMNGNWQLRISADGVVIAEHSFAWEESTTKVIRRHVREDGELSNEVRAMMAENRLQRMSLDELLSDQEIPEDEERRQESRR